MLNDKAAGVLTLIDIGKRWLQNQIFLHLDQYRPPCKLSTKSDIACFFVWNHNLFILYNRTAGVKKIFDKSFKHPVATHQVLAHEFTLYFVHAGRQSNFET